jgi:plasmid stabilization system protein ParE
MAEVTWARTALADLVSIAEYIAIYNPAAAGKLVRKIRRHIDQLADHPKLGTALPIKAAHRYRQVVEPPCRVIYRISGDSVLIVAIQRCEQSLRIEELK